MVSTSGGCGCPEEMIFNSLFLLWENVVVLKQLIFNSFYIRRMWWCSKK